MYNAIFVIIIQEYFWIGRQRRQKDWKARKREISWIFREILTRNNSSRVSLITKLKELARYKKSSFAQCLIAGSAKNAATRNHFNVLVKVPQPVRGDPLWVKASLLREIKNRCRLTVTATLLIRIRTGVYTLTFIYIYKTTDHRSRETKVTSKILINPRVFIVWIKKKKKRKGKGK